MTTYPEYQHITNTQGLVDAAPIQIRNMNVWGNNGYNQTVFTNATSTYYDAYHDQHFPLYDAKTNDYEYTRRINLAYGPQVSRNVAYAGQILQANTAPEGMNAWYDLRDIISRYPNLWIQGFKYYSTGTFLTDTFIYNKNIEYGLQGSYWVTYILGNTYPYNMNNVDYLPFHDANDTTDVIVQQIKPFGRVSDEVRFSFGEWMHFTNMPLLVPMAYIAFSDQLMPPVPIVIDDSGNNNDNDPIPPVTPIDDSGDGDDTGVIIDDQGNTTPISQPVDPPISQPSQSGTVTGTADPSGGYDPYAVSNTYNTTDTYSQPQQNRSLYYEEDFYDQSDKGVLSFRRILALFNW